MPITPEMELCAAEIRGLWKECDARLKEGDAGGANAAFGRAFELIDAFPAIDPADVAALRFFCILTWVKVAEALDATGQDGEAVEARSQVFQLADEFLADGSSTPGVPLTSLDSVRGLESEESTDLVGRLYLLCSKAGRKDALFWGRCFMDFDVKLHGENPAPPAA